MNSGINYIWRTEEGHTLIIAVSATWSTIMAKLDTGEENSGVGIDLG